MRGVASLQIQAVGNTSFSNDLADDLEDVRGAKHVVPIDEQRIAIRSKTVSRVATAFGIDNKAKELQSDLQRELNVKTPKNPENGGLTISREMAESLDVKRGDKVRVLAFSRSPLIKIRRIQDVSPALSEVVALPRKSIEQLRGDDGPNMLFVQLKDGVSVQRWQRRAEKKLPENATVVTADAQQRQLDQGAQHHHPVLHVPLRCRGAVNSRAARVRAAADAHDGPAGRRRIGARAGIELAAARCRRNADVGSDARAGAARGPLGRPRVRPPTGGQPARLSTQVFNFTMVVEVQHRVVGFAAIATLAVARPGHDRSTYHHARSRRRSTRSLTTVRRHSGGADFAAGRRRPDVRRPRMSRAGGMADRKRAFRTHGNQRDARDRTGRARADGTAQSCARAHQHDRRPGAAGGALGRGVEPATRGDLYRDHGASGQRGGATAVARPRARQKGRRDDRYSPPVGATDRRGR